MHVSYAVTFVIEALSRRVIVVRTVAPSEKLADVLRLAFQSVGLGESTSGWLVLREDKPLALDRTVGELIGEVAQGAVTLTVRCATTKPAPRGAAHDSGERRQVRSPGSSGMAPAVPPPAAPPPIPPQPARKPTSNATDAGASPASTAESEFELTLDESGGLAPLEGDALSSGATAEKKDVFETDFEIPAQDEESGSEVAALDQADTNLESSDFEFARHALEEDSASEVVALDDEDSGNEEHSDSGSVVVEEEHDELGDSEAVAAEETEAPVLSRKKASPARRRRVGQRRATVRYYNRMNPQRVFPLLVVISRQMIDRTVQQQTDQKTSAPFKVKLDSTIEVEPVLPGCFCYPPRATARLGEKDLSLTFHVVPHVLGSVSGARVVIRQDHVTLVRMELDVRVVQRTWVLLSGAMTLGLPFLSALARHFHLDFGARQDDGFNPYLMAANLLCRNLSPVGLTMLLAGITFAMYWFTRPRRKNVFWEIKPVAPREKLRAIAAAMQADPEGAAADLRYLMAAHPRYQPARLFHAEWHYRLENHRDASRSYEKAFALGKAAARHYLQASLAASKLNDHARALRILQDADAVLPAAGMKGVMFFNMGCYHCRFGRPDEAMKHLRRAVSAGYRNLESWSGDSDLDPLRDRPDFRELVAGIQEPAMAAGK